MCAALPQPLPQQFHASAQHNNCGCVIGNGQGLTVRVQQAPQMMIPCRAQGKIGSVAASQIGVAHCTTAAALTSQSAVKCYACHSGIIYADWPLESSAILPERPAHKAIDDKLPRTQGNPFIQQASPMLMHRLLVQSKES